MQKTIRVVLKVAGVVAFVLFMVAVGWLVVGLGGSTSKIMDFLAGVRRKVFKSRPIRQGDEVVGSTTEIFATDPSATEVRLVGPDGPVVKLPKGMTAAEVKTVVVVQGGGYAVTSNHARSTDLFDAPAGSGTGSGATD